MNGVVQSGMAQGVWYMRGGLEGVAHDGQRW